MKLLLITWRDAVSNHAGWAKLSEIDKQRTPVVRSVGWLRKRTKTELTLVASIMDDEGSQDVTIPTGWIIREQELTAK